jgi:ribosome-binding factor A
MAKIERLNELIHEELALAINREVGIEGALITITYVNCSTDLKQAHIGFSVLPDKLAGSAMRKLSSATRELAQRLTQRIKLRKLPKLIWEFDATEREASKIEDLIKQANSEDYAD